MSLNVLNDLKNTILELIGDLKENVFTETDEQGDLMVVEFFFKRMHPERVMEHIIHQVLPHKSKIRVRDVTFFLENKGIFSGLPDDRVNYYSEFIADRDQLTKEDRTVIWEYFDTMIALAESYRKEK